MRHVNINGQPVTVTMISGAGPISLRERHALELMDTVLRFDSGFLERYWRYDLAGASVARDASPNAPWCLFLRYAFEDQHVDFQGRLGDRLQVDLEHHEVVVPYSSTGSLVEH